VNESLRIVRACALVLFGVGAALSAWSLIQEHASFLWFAALTHLGLCVFIATEAFGPIAKIRPRATRLLSRVFFVPSVIVVVGIGTHLVRSVAK